MPTKTMVAHTKPTDANEQNEPADAPGANGANERADAAGANPQNEREPNNAKKSRPEILEIKDLHAAIDGEPILKGLTLTISSGEIHAIMGPNGSGKSTLCKVLMGHPKYEVTGGSATLNGINILELEPNERAHLGLFLGFQHPIEIPGVTLGNFLRQAKNANNKAGASLQGERRPSPQAERSEAEDTQADAQANAQADTPTEFTPLQPLEFAKNLKAILENLKMDGKFIGRAVNEGFSGGEKKRAEIAQMTALQPKIALLDEIDSGLDIDALKTVAAGINENFTNTNCGILLITHYQRILNYIEPHHVHIMKDGRIIRSGDKSLAQELEEKGYEDLAD